MAMSEKILSVAPMLDWTDRHCRHFLRLICPSCVLYTEMLTTNALLLGRDPQRFLEYSAAEHPLILQVGGDDPEAMRRVSWLAREYQYDGINLNVGCPSPRVQKGSFGACLMATPEHVATLMTALADSGLPVSIKHRLGLDREENYAALQQFVGRVAQSGCRHFIVHARNAWLKGLNPAENREIPPLRWDWVQQLKQDFPHLQIEINGGFKAPATVLEQYPSVDGVMIGRAAYHNPLLLAEVEIALGRRAQLPERGQILEDLMTYAESWGETLPAPRLSRHLHGLYYGVAGAGEWRRFLGTAALNESAADFLRRALQQFA
ncbi:tRNA dihydrouridine(20/20a) synthase DusA [Acidithiobacillus montserratensis]|uniref:tRNA dihydrouridine(20/20a) synthase DusA n=1 Tax=Acidithiobacillus montserratensis TaxID=2729135 RepID=A0ACD5HJH7_9PROT|nr:tRNA dihydrouridine(20/20a) synthase DusA [Acidithiobacillus montserratensis]MBN2680685.1 tRNA dihydrouridine(20/20a) synthase DusA [Acidithiobacillaceae bacterium]MBU2748706.1 tRNA dihydrouridine(20/20a) synthase DusA [Acidithiobacillus montserratensis]